MSDTGGGHRAACRAIMAGLDRHHAGAYTAEMVDMWADYMPYPSNRMPRTYTQWINLHAPSYEAQYWTLDRLFRWRAWSDTYCRIMLPRMTRFYREHPADLYICAHSVFVRPAVYAHDHLLLTAPFITVITDWALPTVLWYDRRALQTLVPTEPAYQLGIQSGVPRERLQLAGAVVHPKFADLAASGLTKTEARQKLNLRDNSGDGLKITADERIILLVGGGDGMGPIVQTARAIDDVLAGRPIRRLIVIAGRNSVLQTQLNTIAWQGKVTILGFRDDLHLLMRAADVMISKAGPATITEAAIMGLPLILSGAIRYQESPNLEYAVARGAALYAPGAQKVATAVAALLNGDPAQLEAMSLAISALAEPDAIWKITDAVWQLATPDNL